jgi:ADP-dependent NAD(P)H-hydrate dehydratase / NAD(P)H-hydrate epimerase
MYLYRAANIKALDSSAIRAGIPLELLMDAAGRAVAEVIKRDYPVTARVAVICGKGMNGGDGLSCARWLLAWGYAVRVLAHPEAGQTAPSSLMRRALEAFGVQFETLNENFEADVIVDALLGVSFQAPLRELEASVIKRMNSSGVPIIAVDLPSGVTADSSEAPTLAVQAAKNVALSGLKPCLTFGAARDWAGVVEVAEIGLPPALALEHASAEMLIATNIASHIPKRSRDAHKGTAGRVLIIGGSPNFPGAPALSALGAFRTGSGLVTIATVPGAATQAPVETTRLEIATWNAANLEPLQHHKTDAIAAGMGLGSSDPALLEAICELNAPLLLDADALQLSLEPWLRKREARGLSTVLTPHPGEAARLLECSTSDITGNMLEAARKLGERYAAVIVLKGSPSVIAARGKLTQINTTGNPGMAVGGAGDVLAGIIASLIGQGLEAWQAARVGVSLHGLAGDIAARERGIGLISSEIAYVVPEAMLQMETFA